VILLHKGDERDVKKDSYIRALLSSQEREHTVVHELKKVLIDGVAVKLCDHEIVNLSKSIRGILVYPNGVSCPYSYLFVEQSIPFLMVSSHSPANASKST